MPTTGLLSGWPCIDPKKPAAPRLATLPSPFASQYPLPKPALAMLTVVMVIRFQKGGRHSDGRFAGLCGRWRCLKTACAIHKAVIWRQAASGTKT